MKTLINKLDDNKSKNMLISKYSCSDDGVRRDSVAFLYDKLRDQLDKTPDSSIDIIGDYPVTLSPFCAKRNKEEGLAKNNGSDEFEKSIKNVNFNIQMDSIRNERKDSISNSKRKCDDKYSNFRKGDKGVLTLEELLISDNNETPSKESRIKRYEAKDIDENSKMTLSNISYHDANCSKNSLSQNKKRSKSKSNVDNNQNQNEILDFSSIKKLEESESTLRKDSSAPDLYGSLPIQKNIEVSPEVKSKDKNRQNRVREFQREDESKFSDEKRSTLPLHSDSFKKNDGKCDNYIFQQDKQETIDYRNKNESSICSPNFMGIGNLSSSNPFMPCDSKQKSLDYESSPKELFGDPVNSLRIAIIEFTERYGKSKLNEIINFINPSNSKDACVQVSAGRNDIIKLELAEQENNELRLQIKHCLESNSKLKEKYETFCEKSSNLEKTLRERDNTIYSMRLETDALSTELKNSKLLEEHMKNEIELIKLKRDEIEDKLKELKILRGQETIHIRKLKSEIEIKKKEIIEASELTNRVSIELEEIRKENKEIKHNSEVYESERFNFISKIKKLEREIYRISTEKKRLLAVVEIQKGSLNDMDKDYSKLLCEHIEGEKTFYNTLKGNDSILPFDTTKIIDNSTVKYKNYQSKPNLIINSKQENLMHSFDNILTPLEAKSHYDQMSPFSSAKTLNRLENIRNDRTKFKIINDTARCNRKIPDISESNLTLKDGSLSPDVHYEHSANCEYINKSHSKNMSFTSTCRCMDEVINNSILQSCSKCNISRYRQDVPLNTTRSPYSDEKDSLKKKYCNQKKGKIRIINQDKSKCK